MGWKLLGEHGPDNPERKRVAGEQNLSESQVAELLANIGKCVVKDGHRRIIKRIEQNEDGMTRITLEGIPPKPGDN